MDGAAAGGHLEMVQWLHKNRSEVRPSCMHALHRLLRVLDVMHRSRGARAAHCARVSAVGGRAAVLVLSSVLPRWLPRLRCSRRNPSLILNRAVCRCFRARLSPGPCASCSQLLLHKPRRDYSSTRPTNHAHHFFSMQLRVKLAIVTGGGDGGGVVPIAACSSPGAAFFSSVRSKRQLDVGCWRAPGPQI